MKPHKWAKEIKAWADGAEIEVRFDGGKWIQNLLLCWDWDNAEYRIIPQPKEPQYLYVYKGKGYEYNFSIEKYLAGSAYMGTYIGKIKLEVDDN